MRYFLAIATLVLAGVLLVLGVGQRTFLAGPAELRYPIAEESDAPYFVVDADDMQDVPGQGNVVLTSPDSFVAIAKTRDIAGWIAPFESDGATYDPATKTFVVKPGSGAVADDTGADQANADAAPAEGDAAATDAAETDESIAAMDPVNPRGSDLWLQSIEGPVEGEQQTRLPISLQADESLLFATDGEAPAPEDAALVWVQDRNTPWAGPLLTAGGVLALVGLVLYLLAFDHDRRGLGPRRGRRGAFQGIRNMFRSKKVTPILPEAPKSETPAAAAPAAVEGSAPEDEAVAPSSEVPEATEPDAAVDVAGPAEPTPTSNTGNSDGGTKKMSRFALPVVGMAAVLGLSGCSPTYWPNFDTEEPAVIEEVAEGSGAAPVPVTDGQIAAILDNVAEVTKKADADLDAELLAQRFTGDALTQRTANYTIRKSVSDYASIPDVITSESRDYQLVQSTEGWPRTLFLTVASKAPEAAEGEAQAEAPSVAMLLTQESPHTNYLVTRVFSLRGGITMPQAAPAEVGTALLANDISTIAATPDSVGEMYAKFLATGKDAEGAELFDLEDNLLLEKYGAAWVAQSKEKADTDKTPMKFSVTAAQGDQPVVALSTGLGGALVATTVLEDQIVESDGFAPKAANEVTAISGLEGQKKKLVREVAHQLLFYVPTKDSGEKIQLLGVTSELVGAKE
ncbi:glycosyltransferase [Leucobacter sp. cx-42]|uniref:glycosyltransferase n=1 Tax=unclassified Leucobacter TaxID=2621730 RepID=UPI00165E3C8E|nr:glycosyltransferase [Leucobacter sp. cx-42]